MLDEKYFSSYDAYGAEGYVLMDGDYYVAVGGNAHEAVNNVLATKKANGISVDESNMIGTYTEDADPLGTTRMTGFPANGILASK